MSSTGNKSTLTFVTSGFVGRYTQFGALSQYREQLEDTALADGYQKSCPGSVLKTDPIDIELFWDQSVRPPIDAAPEQIVLRHAPKEGQATGDSVQCEAFIARSTGPVLANGQRKMGSFQLVLNLTAASFVAGS